MNMLSNIAEAVAVGVGSFFKTSLPSYCDIETNDTETSLVTTRGTLVSGIRISGMRMAVGPDEFEATVNTVTRALQSFLMNQGHTIDIFAERDASAVRGHLEKMADGVRETCDKLGLEMEDVVAANTAELAKHTADESVYIAFWTRTSVLNKSELQTGMKSMSEAAVQLPNQGWNRQDMLSTLPVMRERHASTVRSILQDLKSAGIACELLTSHEMLREARMRIDPEYTPDNWMPTLVGDKIPGIHTPGMLREESKTELDVSDIQWPTVANQLFPRNAKRVNTKFVVVGDRAFAPVFIEIPPREIMPFSSLFEKLSTAQVPWRVMFRLDGGGLKFSGSTETIAQFLSLTSPFNARVSEALKKLKAIEFQGNTNVRFRASLCTWAPATNLPLLARRSSRLAQTVAAWGQCEVREVSGDPMLGLISTIPFVSEECAARAGIAPLSHVVRMLPLMRPSSPWKSGSIIYRTMDGRLMPFQPGSSLQTTWNYILFGRPGFGKSVQMLNLILGSCMQPGLSRLPRVGIVDIGPSSQYFVNMLRDSLPREMRHLVAGFKLSMTAEDAINPFDLPLGCRFPTPEHTAFVVNILSQLATPAESSASYPRMSELTSKVVEEVYAKYSGETSSSTPKRFSLGTEPKVDALLKTYGFIHDRDTSWYHVVDFLAAKGHTHEGTMAMRNAVPTLSDCVALPQNIVEAFQNIKVDSGETLPQAFMSLISSAMMQFPNLSTTTRFDIGEVRIAAINLEDVAKSGSVAADRQSAVMYLLASYALTKDYRYNEKTVLDMKMPEQYREYHLKRARETKEDLKWICYDEFHRTSKSPAVQASVLVDMREGRKFNIGVILSSQGADDFPATMREFATATFIVDAGSAKNVDALQKFFEFNDTARALLTNYVNGPKSSGAPLLAVINTKQGPFVQLLVSTLGLETRWALSTTMEDVLVREQVCQRLGAQNGRMALARKFPNGAKDIVEAYRLEGKSNAVNMVAEEVLAAWQPA
jgi:intracellular multiplication protein IcmB